MPVSAEQEAAANVGVAVLPQHTRLAIVGAGFSGLGLAIRLKQQGRDDFEVLERAGDVGGTWRDNTYPGCSVCPADSAAGGAFVSLPAHAALDYAAPGPSYL